VSTNIVRAGTDRPGCPVRRIVAAVRRRWPAPNVAAGPPLGSGGDERRGCGARSCRSRAAGRRRTPRPGRRGDRASASKGAGTPVESHASASGRPGGRARREQPEVPAGKGSAPDRGRRPRARARTRRTWHGASAPSERPVGSRSASSDHTDRRGEPPAEHEDLGRSRRGRWPPGGGLGGRRGLGGSDRADPTARYRDPDEPHPGRGRGVGRDTRACRRRCNPDDREVRARPYRSDLSKSAPCFCRGGHRSPRTLVVADRRPSADRRGSRARKGRLTPSVEW